MENVRKPFKGFRYLLAALIILFGFSSQAGCWTESPAVDRCFQEAGVIGTFVLYDVSADVSTGYNGDRAEKRFVPASTFKVANSLIGLSTGAVKSVDETLPYQGPAQPFSKAWEKDMGLREAIVLSNVPIYQELARRIGLERMREDVVLLDYGNKNIGTSVDTFWLVGPLMISAGEQTRFLARLAQGTLPLPQGAQKSVREIMLLEQGAGWNLYGKTGWENAPGKGIGWWVGWVEKKGRIYAFALNIDVQTPTDAPKRIEVGKASLKALGIL
jgi:beta-lactamase class D